MYEFHLWIASAGVDYNALPRITLRSVVGRGEHPRGVFEAARAADESIDWGFDIVASDIGRLPSVDSAAFSDGLSQIIQEHMDGMLAHIALVDMQTVK